jgi:hypothetical protein
VGKREDVCPPYGLLAARELLLNTPLVANLIAEEKAFQGVRP